MLFVTGHSTARCKEWIAQMTSSLMWDHYHMIQEVVALSCKMLGNSFVMMDPLFETNSACIVCHRWTAKQCQSSSQLAIKRRGQMRMMGG
jgi:hypothetical protein